MKKVNLLTTLASLLSVFAFTFTIQSGCMYWAMREPKMPESMIEE
ncbi:hypothetical protein CACET_c05800 [Clostridium aceticum]|uniref:Cyclic lactone autoinducer peptide n=1 Tax=Clostridium aceticum TaxID=84022 RepID=A0A0G3W8B7_9CLOT|nr:hypothetical protein [Clostridium aceticum]AKL94090.1 hypothetical protein CACET_c05800 [Clostridium aceticum]